MLLLFKVFVLLKYEDKGLDGLYNLKDLIIEIIPEFFNLKSISIT